MGRRMTIQVMERPWHAQHGLIDFLDVSWDFTFEVAYWEKSVLVIERSGLQGRFREERCIDELLGCIDCDTFLS